MGVSWNKADILAWSPKNITFFCHCTETRHFIDGWYVRWAVVSKGMWWLWRSWCFNIIFHTTSRSLQWFLIQLWQMCSWSLFFNPCVIITVFLYFLLKKNMVFSITTYPFTRRCSPYAPAINKMPSFCAMAKECNIVSFELCSNMLNSQWNGDVFNQWFVISPRTRVLHVCLPPKQQTLSILASGENWFLFNVCLKNYNSGLITWGTK